MIRKIGTRIAAFGLMLFVAMTLNGGLAFAATAPATSLPSDSKQAACEGLNATGGGTTCTSTGTTVDGVIRIAVQLLSAVAGIAAVIMLIIAGIRYITSSGDAAGVKGAKDAIVYAIIGLLVVAVSQIVVQFVLKKVN